MAESDSTLGYCFVESKILAKTKLFHLSEHAHCLFWAISELNRSLSFDVNLPVHMEALRSHVNYLLTLPLPVREKNRLIFNYWELEFQLDEFCLLVDEILTSG